MFVSYNPAERKAGGGYVLEAGGGVTEGVPPVKEPKMDGMEAEAKRLLLAMPSGEKAHCDGYPGWGEMSWSQRLVVAKTQPQPNPEPQPVHQPEQQSQPFQRGVHVREGGALGVILKPHDTMPMVQVDFSGSGGPPFKWVEAAKLELAAAPESEIVAALQAEIAALRQVHAQEVDALKAGHQKELAAERARNAALATELEATRQPPEPEPEPQ